MSLPGGSISCVTRSAIITFIKIRLIRREDKNNNYNSCFTAICGPCLHLSKSQVKRISRSWPMKQSSIRKPDTINHIDWVAVWKKSCENFHWINHRSSTVSIIMIVEDGIVQRRCSRRFVKIRAPKVICVCC